MKLIKLFIYSGIIALALNCSIFAQQTGRLDGQIVDTLGAVVVGATVTVAAADGMTQSISPIDASAQ